MCIEDFIKKINFFLVRHNIIQTTTVYRITSDDPKHPKMLFITGKLKDHTDLIEDYINKFNARHAEEVSMTIGMKPMNLNKIKIRSILSIAHTNISFLAIQLKKTR